MIEEFGGKNANICDLEIICSTVHNQYKIGHTIADTPPSPSTLNVDWTEHQNVSELGMKIVNGFKDCEKPCNIDWQH